LEGDDYPAAVAGCNRDRRVAKVAGKLVLVTVDFVAVNVFVAADNVSTAGAGRIHGVAL
jgi:hypothetical protein